MVSNLASFYFHFVSKSTMMSFLAGLRFIVNTSLLKNETKGGEHELSLSNGKTPLLLHTPSGKEKGLIISLTGFSVNGNHSEN